MGENAGVQAWGSDWLPEVRRVAELLGGILGAPPGSVTLHQNVATLTAIVVSALDFTQGRDTVVLAADDWPGHGYLAQGLPGARVVVAGGDGLLEAVDERTALVLVGHVLFRTSAIVDVAAACARAREVGALSMVDGYPRRRRAVRRRGGDGLRLLRRRQREVARAAARASRTSSCARASSRPCAPRMWGGWANAAPFDFDAAWTPAGGALGWLGGTPAIPAIASAREGYAIVAEVGPDRIRATSQRLTQLLVEGALDGGSRCTPRCGPRTGPARSRSPVGEDTARAAERLIAAGIVVDYRPERAGSGVVRVGPHFFSTAEELSRVLANLRP